MCACVATLPFQEQREPEAQECVSCCRRYHCFCCDFVDCRYFHAYGHVGDCALSGDDVPVAVRLTLHSCTVGGSLTRKGTATSQAHRPGSAEHSAASPLPGARGLSRLRRLIGHIWVLGAISWHHWSHLCTHRTCWVQGAISWHRLTCMGPTTALEGNKSACHW